MRILIAVIAVSILWCVIHAPAAWGASNTGRIAPQVVAEPAHSEHQSKAKPATPANAIPDDLTAMRSEVDWMEFFKLILASIVPICAITGAVLGVFNFLKDRKRENIQAKQNLVRAEWRAGRTPTNERAADLYVVNNDSKPVTAIQGQFFADDTDDKTSAAWEWPSLGGDGDSAFVLRQSRGPGGPRRVMLAYTDAAGRRHGPYPQNKISKAG